MEVFTKEWISPLQKSTLSNDRSPWPEERVRIAIIDSGIRKEDAKIAAANIRDCRNFTSSEDCEDPIGHGTMVARLLSEVAPEAELYIAKVSTKHSIPKNQLHHIAEVRTCTFSFLPKTRKSLIKETGHQMGRSGLRRRYHLHIFSTL